MGTGVEGLRACRGHEQVADTIAAYRTIVAGPRVPLRAGRGRRLRQEHAGTVNGLLIDRPGGP